MKKKMNEVALLYLGIILFFLMDLLYYIKSLSEFDITLLLDIRERLPTFHQVFLLGARYMNLYILTIVIVEVLFL